MRKTYHLDQTEMFTALLNFLNEGRPTDEHLSLRDVSFEIRKRTTDEGEEYQVDIQEMR